MIKNRTIVETELNGRMYRLECFPESPVEEVLQALSVFNEIVSRIKPQQEQVTEEIVEAE